MGAKLLREAFAKLMHQTVLPTFHEEELLLHGTLSHASEEPLGLECLMNKLLIYL